MDVTALIEQLGLKRGSMRGRVAVITGAGSLIGRECARALAWLGIKVVVAERSLAFGSETSMQIQHDGGEVIFVHSDARTLESTTSLAARTHAAFGTVDILVNCIDPTHFTDPCDEAATPDIADDFLRSSATLICRQFLPEMLARKRGVILNILPLELSGEQNPPFSFRESIFDGCVTFTHAVGNPAGISAICFEPVARPNFLPADPNEAFPLPTAAEYNGAAITYLTAMLAQDFHGKIVDADGIMKEAVKVH